MKTSRKTTTHKLGANHNELAHRPRKHDLNFAQSRDICEDRGERQIKQLPACKYARLHALLNRQLLLQVGKKDYISPWLTRYS